MTSLPSYTSATLVNEDVSLLKKQEQTTIKGINGTSPPTNSSRRAERPSLTKCSRLHGRAKEQAQLWDIHQSNIQVKKEQRRTSKVVLVRGPRGCGKTELVRRTLQGGAYVHKKEKQHYLTTTNDNTASTSISYCNQSNQGHLMVWKSDPQTLLQIGPGVGAAMERLVEDLLSRSEDEWQSLQQHFWTNAKLDAIQIATLLLSCPQLKPLLVNPALVVSPPPSAAAAGSLQQRRRQEDRSEEVQPFSRPEYRLDYSAYRTLLRAISSVDFPMTFMTDDFNWIEPNSLKWVMNRVADLHTEGALFVGTFTDDDDPAGDEGGVSLWRQTIEEWKQQDHVEVTEICLQNLDESTTHDMVAEMLMTDNGSVAAISSWVYQQTNGNPQYIEELLLGLRNEGLLRNSSEGDESGWILDLEQASASATIGTTVEIAPVSAYLAKTKLAKLPEALQEVLKVAACLGSLFETHLVSSAMSSSSGADSTTTETSLELAKEAGIIVDCFGSFTSKRACRFVHNSMHEAAISLVGTKQSEERAHFHLVMTRRLLRNLSAEELEADLLTVSGQLIFGAGAIKRKEEKYQCAQLAYRATQGCVRLTSFKSAHKSISFAIDMLEADTSNHAWREEYDLTLAIFNAAAEVAYANGDFELVEARVGAVMKFGRSFEDKLQANCTKLCLLGSTDTIDEAVELGFALLDELGEPFPKKPSRANILYSMFKTKSLLKGKSDEVLLRSPVMTDGRVIAAMQVLNILFTSVFLAKPIVAPLLATRMVQLSLNHGFCAYSCAAFSVYGMLLCSRGTYVKEGTRFGELSMRLLDRFQTKEFIPRVFVSVYGYIHGWSRPFEQSFEPLRRGYRVGLETGDIAFAMRSAILYIYYSFYKGKPLSVLAEKRAVYIEQVANVHKEATILMSSPLFYTIDHLMGLESVYSLHHKVDNLSWSQYQTIIIEFIQGDFKNAVLAGRQCNQVPYAGFNLALFYMFEGLANLALFKESGKRGLVAFARRRLKTLDRISKQAAENCLGNFLLLEAELSSLSPRNHKDTVRKYLCAIGLADSTKSLFEGAVAHEHYGRYLQSCGKKTAAASSLSHLQTACSLYRQWNAYPKADALQSEINKKAECETKS